MPYTSRQPRSIRCHSCEEFEARLCLSAISFKPHDVIVSDVHRAASVFAADLDGDSDMDVLSASTGDNRIAWYENTDGKGSFGRQQVITRSVRFVRGMHAADMDGDGDVDVLSAFLRDGKIAWYENTDGKGSFGQQMVITMEAFGVQSVHAADVDGDGDVDVLSAASTIIAWYENTDGKGNFSEQQVITNAVHSALSVYSTDIDGDGDVDVLSASLEDQRVAWYEQLPHVAAGDANRDFQFDQLDIVQVLQAAKYLTGDPATFDEGDWNGDGVFDQLDIVAALQTDNYLQGPYMGRSSERVVSQIGS